VLRRGQIGVATSEDDRGGGSSAQEDVQQRAWVELGLGDWF
jgi:hypothetical protein